MFLLPRQVHRICADAYVDLALTVSENAKHDLSL